MTCHHKLRMTESIDPLTKTLEILLPLVSAPVRVKGGMSLRNGMWHGLRNDIIIRNVKYGKRRQKINLLKSMHVSLPCLFLAPI